MKPQQLRALFQDMDRVLILKKPNEWRVTLEQYKALLKEFPDGKYKGIRFVKFFTEKQ